jgi:hypothetical protein
MEHFFGIRIGGIHRNIQRKPAPAEPGSSDLEL